MTDAELQKLAEAAHVKPWEYGRNPPDDEMPAFTVSCPYKVDEVGTTVAFVDVHHEFLAAYIVAACNAVPSLLDRLKAADERIANLEARIAAAEAGKVKT